MRNIDYYLFTLSPFCYLAGGRLEAIARKHDVRISYRPFDLMKVFSKTGTPLPKDRHPSRQAYRFQELRRIAEMNSVPINLQPAHWPTGPLPSCRAIIAAGEVGGGNIGGLVHAILRACWVEEKDISEQDVLAECLEKNGFPASVLEEDMAKTAEVFERNTEEALERGVFGAPSYLVDDQLFWGQDRLTYLDAWLDKRPGT